MTCALAHANLGGERSKGVYKRGAHQCGDAAAVLRNLKLPSPSRVCFRNTISTAQAEIWARDKGDLGESRREEGGAKTPTPGQLRS
uniref:Uncharacterized protein n=1 Tax=Anguilla anguilla TaxID=7936 RepID=A0A0E9WAG9_ANGAN